MDVREKLVELIGSTEYGNGSLVGKNFQKGFIEKIASNLIAHGVTVQDGKPLEAFLHPIDAYKGLKAKYLVFKAETGKVVDNCFVLRPDKDVAAVEALRAYANATDNKTLAEDIYSWVGKGEPVQEWISVSEPPEENGYYLCYVLTSAVGDKAKHEQMPLYWEDDIWLYRHNSYRMCRNVTYWMPLPTAPEVKK